MSENPSSRTWRAEVKGKALSCAKGSSTTTLWSLHSSPPIAPCWSLPNHNDVNNVIHGVLIYMPQWSN